jgi:hypothetical protein
MNLEAGKEEQEIQDDDTLGKGIAGQFALLRRMFSPSPPRFLFSRLHPRNFSVRNSPLENSNPPTAFPPPCDNIAR